MIGSTLSQYRIIAKLGAGGMGEVYRAEDTKLGREVAIKVLPKALSRDKERLARFGREAKLLAALNHPSIATLHGLEESGGTPFLVMELIEGETLAQRISKGALPVEEALPLLAQVAEALEAAHQKGIIHRDLKPANIKVTPEGRVKVLDFGLAKALAGEEETGVDSSQSPTLTKGTALGTIMGTAAYMSPEQARGKTVDKRADTWALGCVLFEALSGRKAFDGETVTDILAAVVHEDPPWDTLPERTPQRIRELLERCLQKDPRRRLRDAGDAWLALEEGVHEPEHAPTPFKPRSRAWQVSWLMLGLVLGAIAATLFIWSLSRTSEDVRSEHLAILLPPNMGLRRSAAEGTNIAVSPDGGTIAFVAVPQGSRDPSATRLYLRPIDGDAAEPVPGTEGASQPFFSPDGRWLGFFAGGKLKKVPITGGGVTVLCNAVYPGGGAWRSDGQIIFAADRDGIVLQRVSADGGEPDILARLEMDEGERQQNFPQILPDGKHLLFMSWGRFEESCRIVAMSLETGQRKTLVDGSCVALYTPTGHLVYAHGSQLFAAPYDPESWDLRETPVSLLYNLASDPDHLPQFTLSAAGIFAYAPGGILDSETALVWIDRGGQSQRIKGELSGLWQARLSPNGKQIALAMGVIGQSSDIYTHDIERGATQRSTSDPADDASPVWSPEGDGFVYSSNLKDKDNLFLKTATREPEALLPGGNSRFASSWSRDGRWIAYTESHPTTDNDIWLLRMERGERTPEVFLQTPFREGDAKFCPIAPLLAYRSNETGRNEIWVRPYPASPADTAVLVSTDGGTFPFWSQDGRELYYRDGSKLMAVAVDYEPELRFGVPRELFDEPTLQVEDVGSDGRFLAIELPKLPPVTHLNVVLNFFEELKRLAPAEERN